MYDWVGKMIPWELCKRLKFDQANKWYILKLESVQQNKTHKILRDFEIQTDYLIQTKRPDLVCNNKKKKSFSIFYHSRGP